MAKKSKALDFQYDVLGGIGASDIARGKQGQASNEVCIMQIARHLAEYKSPGPKDCEDSCDISGL